MRYPRKWQLAGVCLLALALLTFAPAPRGTAQAPGYTVTDLGTLGGLESRAYGLDECGRVVGESQAAAGESAPFRPFHWDGTTLTDLGTLGGNTGLATALNQGGTIVGSSLTSGGLLRPFLLPPGGTMINLNSLGGFTAEAQDVNASGQVVGQSEDGSLQDRAFIWQDANLNGVSDAGEMQALTAPWGTPIRAFGINDAGQIAGSANLSSSGTHAFVTIGGVAVDLGTLGGAVSVATDVNDVGEVTGYSYIFSPTISQSFHAFRWKDLNGNNLSDAGEMTDLGVLGGDKNSYAYDVNDVGQVVGYSETGAPGNGNVTRAFLWTSANGMQNLNAVATGTGWTFQEARAINDRGQIVGTGLNPDGKVHAFLLTPTNVGPSPCDPTPTPTPVPGTLQFSASTYTVAEDGGSVVISVSRTGGSDGSVSVNYATSDGTAAQPADYATASGTLTFADGETTKTFSVTINDDTLHEAQETVNLTLSSPGGGASLGSPTAAILTITDNDNQPTLQFSSATYSVSEGSATATITVTRTGGTNGGATVNYSTAPGTANAGSDFTGTGGTLTFAPGDNSETFTVAIANDGLDEADETVNLSLSVPGGGAVLGAQATAVLTITDDDATPTLSIGDVTVAEGNTGTTPSTTATFAVTLTGASAQTVTVNYATANGSATQPADYTPASGTVTFTPGETGAKNVNVLVAGDTADEPNETFNVNLSNASASATIADAQGVVTINDDDGAPSLNINDVSVVEGNAGTTAATFTVSLLPASGQTVTVNYATADGTATTAGSDYTAKSGTLTFAATETTKTITINVTGETAAEAHENFVVNLSGATNAELGDSQGQGTINNDDTTLSIDNQINVANEGNSGETSFVFTVSLSHVSALPVSVNYSTADVTATAGEDYVAANNLTLTIPAGSTTGTITVKVKGDNKFEDYEDFVVNLSGVVNAVLGNAQGRASIRNDEAASLFQISGPNPASIGEGGNKATFTITRTGSTAGGATVNYSTGNGTATAGADYTAVSGSFTFAEGETSKTFDVFVTNDTLDEPAETVIVSLTPGFGASAGTSSSVTLNINDDDIPPTFQFNSATYSVAEGSGSVVNVEITVTRTGGTNASSVGYATSDGTATTGDYASSFGTLNFAEGETSKTFGVSVAGDTLDEPNETVNLALSAGSGVALGTPSTAVLTITDNDATPTLQLNSATYTVSESGVTATVTVTRTGGTNGGVTVNYATSNGTATAAGGDYTAASGTLTFTEGDNSETFTVVINNDALDEPNETVNLTLSSPGGGAALGTQTTAILTITDDDATPTLSISNATAAEGQGTASFNVMLSAPSGQTVTVSYSTADDTAVAPGDYIAVPSGSPTTLTFAPGEISKPATVTVNNDALDEPDETFNVSLSNPANATLSDGAAVGTINDDDEPPSLFINDRNNIQENVAGAIFVVTLSAPSGRTVTVNYATADGTALAGSDYTTSSGTLTFNPGQTSQELAVFTSNDNLDEANETYFVNLSGATNAAIADAQGTGTLVDDDDAPSLSINDVARPELGGVAPFTVTLSAPSGQTVTVKYATADGTAGTSTDYVAASGTLTFSPGQTEQTINVQLGSDNFDEPDEETFFVNLSDATNATIADAQGVGTVVDNDETPKLFINDLTITEGDSGTTNATFTVSLGPATARTVTVDYATANHTAGAGGDYVAQSGTLTFAGESSKTVTIQVVADTVNEANESFYVILSNPTHASILDTHGECFITNDDAPAVRFSQATYPAGEGVHFVTVTVTRTGDPLMPFGVDFATSDGTATERRDYTAVSGKLQFASGETSKTFDVLLTEDSYQESEETINLTLSNPTGVVVVGTQPTATVNIAADDTNQPQPNPIDESSNFVRQHYHDFLNREPDASGLAFWTGEIEGCGANAGCREAKRINVSAAFFLSIEFQQTGYLVYRTYKAAFGDAISPNVEGTVPVVRLQEFLPDTRRIGQGVVVGEPNWEQKLDANKNAYLLEFVQRQRFLTAFPTTMTAAQFVDKLNQNAGGVLTQGERDALVGTLAADAAAPAARAQALRSVAENNALQQNEFRRAFVLMQFYGYLRRNPDDPQDTDFRGWKFWLDKLNQFNGNYVQAEMVKAFLDSIEYRTRFAP